MILYFIYQQRNRQQLKKMSAGYYEDNNPKREVLMTWLLGKGLEPKSEGFKKSINGDIEIEVDGTLYKISHVDYEESE